MGDAPCGSENGSLHDCVLPGEKADFARQPRLLVELAFGDVAIAGSRGWTCPGSVGFDEAADRPIYDREVIRMGLSLSGAPKDKLLLCMMHYPPFNERRQPSGFTELFEQHGAKHVAYGHLHGKACRNAFEGERNGIQYTLCSADHLEFKPKLIVAV